MRCVSVLPNSINLTFTRVCLPISWDETSYKVEVHGMNGKIESRDFLRYHTPFHFQWQGYICIRKYTYFKWFHINLAHCTLGETIIHFRRLIIFHVSNNI